MISKISEKWTQLKNSQEKPKTGRKAAEKRKPPSDYFTNAKSWADDVYTTAIASRNRYKWAFIISMSLSILLCLALTMVLPLQKTALVVVHKSKSGVVWVDPVAQPAPPPNQALTEGEIVRYVVNRESYSADGYGAQFSLVQLMSDAAVELQYVAEQNHFNKSSPINALGTGGVKKVNVENVLFIDSVHKNDPKNNITNHRDLAQINFTVTTLKNEGMGTKTTPYTALLSWGHRGTPASPDARWRNWDGFTVTQYSTQQRNIGR